jgi:DNA-binding NtrC family response regulator
MFLEERNLEQNTDKQFTPAARERISNYGWPGNVRELRNVVHRAFVLGDRDADVDIDLEPRPAVCATAIADGTPWASQVVTVAVGTSLEEAERALIVATLDSVAGSRAQAAKLLGISLKTLYNRLQAYRGVRGGANARPDACRLRVVA